MNKAALLTIGRLSRAEVRKLFTTKAMPVTLAIAIVLAVGSVIIDALVAGRQGTAPLGTDASTNQMLKFGAIPCVVTSRPPNRMRSIRMGLRALVARSNRETVTGCSA